MRPEKVWRAALGELQLQVSRSTFDTWLRNTRLVSFEDGEYIVGVENGFARDWLDARMRTTIERTVAGIIGGPAKVSFVLWQHKPEPAATETPLLTASLATKAVRQKSSRAPGYSFDNFVVGPGSRMAHAAALTVAEAPLPGHNPLVIYGDVGLGKTHLLCATAHLCARAGRSALLITAEDFTNELVSAIRGHTTESFREKYRTVEVLLVDDIQFFVGKKSSSEEFLHTLNALYSPSHQVMLSCDQAPESLAALGRRLCSRLSAGLAVEITAPDAGARAEILRTKAAAFTEPIPDEVITFMAENVGGHVRALEGALHRLVARARVFGTPIDTSSASDALCQSDPINDPVPSDRVIAEVAGRFGITQRELCGKGRARRVAVPRHLAMHILREQGNRSLAEIGELLGGRDHSTVRHGCERAVSLLSRDDTLRSHAAFLRERLSRST